MVSKGFLCSQLCTSVHERSLVGSVWTDQVKGVEPNPLCLNSVEKMQRT